MDVETVSLILSILALLVSGAVALNDHLREIKLNKINLSATYFDEIYKDHLIYKIPQARRMIRFGADNKLADTENMIDELNQIRKDSLYFCYTDEKFYNDIVSKLQNLEDFLIISEDRVILDEQQTAFWNSVQSKLNSIYSCVMNRYQGIIKT